MSQNSKGADDGPGLTMSQTSKGANDGSRLTMSQNSKWPTWAKNKNKKKMSQLRQLSDLRTKLN
jgi:hypothetical protein